MCTGAGVLIGSRSSFSDKSRFNFCFNGTMMAECVSGSMPVNGAFRVHYRTPQWTNTESYGLGCHSISWMITIATNCGQFEQYPIHKRSLAVLRYSFLHGLPGAVFQQDNARPHVAKTVKSYLDSQKVQLLPWLLFAGYVTD
ncbi:hypothetical protein TNCV_4794891 [Trichonephila clavipes]|nr:hypothetical protein TNCV_4794891 [Trichonephila clavipes]